MREMKRTALLLASISGSLWYASQANAQETVVVEETAVVTENVECKTHYTPSSWRDNWYIQLGAGIRSPFVENVKTVGSDGRHITAMYNLGVGRWISPYLGFRFSAYYGSMHWNQGIMNRAKTANVNVDFMWDMFNSIHGYNPGRVFSLVPYIGLGGSFVWDYKAPEANISGKHGIKHNQWLLPVSAGLQMRFRLNNYVDLFAEGRANFYGDNFNNSAYGMPVDVDIAAVGGITVHFTGSKFDSYNPCDYIGYINNLNNQVNDLRGALATTTAALAVAESQLPCPEVAEQTVVVEQAPLMSTVRFRINSAYVSSEEMVNVYNMAQWLKANPETTVIVRGYADKKTGSADYNLKLSERRAQAVTDILTSDYGIDPARLIVEAAGSATQVYDTNDWNRIVIFAQPE